MAQNDSGAIAPLRFSRSLGVNMTKQWLEYEDAAKKVIADIRELLGVHSVEGKQTIAGASGAKWEIDAKAWTEGSNAFLVIEVRRHTSSGLKQEALAAIAYRITDVGAAGGIVVSPLPLQKGAKRVANSANVAHVILTPESTTENYLAEFMGRRFVGVTINESVTATVTLDAVVIRGPRENT